MFSQLIVCYDYPRLFPSNYESITGTRMTMNYHDHLTLSDSHSQCQ